MEALLIGQLYRHLVDYHPDMLIELSVQSKVTGYMQEKVASVRALWETNKESQPEYLTEEMCKQELVADLWPSRYQYLSGVLEEDFAAVSAAWQESGLRTYELINLKGACAPVFEEIGFDADTAESRTLRYAIVGTIQDYLEGNVNN